MGTAMLLRELSKNKGKERIIFHTNSTFFTAHALGQVCTPNYQRAER